MKKIILTIAVVMGLNSVNAQATFENGDIAINLGAGQASGKEADETRSVIYSMALDYGVKEDLFNLGVSATLGGYCSYYSWETPQVIGSSTIIGARAAVHYTFIEKLDTYVGTMLGVNVNTVDLKGFLPDEGANDAVGDLLALGSTNMSYSTFVGARYFFTNNIAVFTEAGFRGVTNVDLGISLKF